MIFGHNTNITRITISAARNHKIPRYMVAIGSFIALTISLLLSLQDRPHDASVFNFFVKMGGAIPIRLAADKIGTLGWRVDRMP
jgi:hypothetical protein